MAVYCEYRTEHTYTIQCLLLIDTVGRHECSNSCA